MRAETIVRACAFVLVVAGTSILAAPAQTPQPGQTTQARVLIENRGRPQAIPVDLRDANLDAPLRVRVVNAETPTANDAPVRTKLVQQAWDYHVVFVRNGLDPVSVLQGPGVAGWEATGVTFVTADGTTLLLKRPR